MALRRDDADLPENPEREPALDRAYAAAEREEPPARLDNAIRAAARREVGAGPSLLASARRTWHVPVSLAAVLVLSATLVTLMKERERTNSRPRACRVPRLPAAHPPASSYHHRRAVRPRGTNHGRGLRPSPRAPPARSRCPGRGRSRTRRRDPRGFAPRSLPRGAQRFGQREASTEAYVNDRGAAETGRECSAAVAGQRHRPEADRAPQVGRAAGRARLRSCR